MKMASLITVWEDGGETCIEIDCLPDGCPSTICLKTEDAVEASYKILLGTQTIEQVMDRLQQEIDDEIEREHGVRTVGLSGEERENEVY
jgi:multidrug efflux pump subunit AcrB